MHHALEVPEIFDNILKFATQNECPHCQNCQARQGQFTALRIAWTCRRFREPAWDVVARECSEFTNLLRLCFPKDLWTKKKKAQKKRSGKK